MKKHSIILIPFLLFSLAGCGKKAQPSQFQIDINQALSLRFDEHFKDNLGEPLSNKSELEEAAESEFRQYGTFSKCASAKYDEVTFVDDHIIENILAVEHFNVHTGSAYTRDRESYRTVMNTSDRSAKNKHFVGHFDNYLEESNLHYYTHALQNGSHSFDNYDFSDRDPAYINQWRNDGIENAEYLIFYEFSSCDFYKVPGGYIALYEKQSVLEDEGDTLKSQEQYIYWLDDDLRIIRATILAERLSNHSYWDNSRTSDLKFDYYEYKIYTANYGVRSSDTIVIDNIKALYDKPYFDTNYAIAYEADETDTKEFRAKPDQVHIKMYIAFDTKRKEEIAITPYVELGVADSMFSDEGGSFEPKDKLALYNPDKLRYFGDNLYYAMSSVDDAILLVWDYMLVDGVPVFLGGYAAIGNKQAIKDYFDNLNY